MPVYMPRHRRALPAYVDLTVADVQNDARCTQFGKPYCCDWCCPRHYEVNYAEVKAVHATDSVRPAR
jgi:hypothetical protein